MTKEARIYIGKKEVSSISGAGKSGQGLQGDREGLECPRRKESTQGVRKVTM